MHLATIDVAKGVVIGTFDGVLVVWLLIGLYRGRKNGMSGELLLLLTWLLIIVGCGHAYRPVGSLILQNVPLFNPLWAYITAYVVIAAAIALTFSKIKTSMGEKLVGSDLFGKGEYYMGMVAGTTRFACMALMFLALLNARIISKAEMDATENMQKKDLGDVRFPTFGQIQQAILFKSYTGPFVRNHVGELLITSVSPSTPQKPRETIATQKQRALDEIIGPSKK